MRIDPHVNDSNSFGRLRFSKNVERCLARASTSMAYRRATDDDVALVLNKASQLFPVATLDAINRMRAKNPDIIQMIEGLGEDDEPMMLAYLPLSREGAERLVEGRLDGRSPRPEWIVGENEIPDAIYIWMAWTTGAARANASRDGTDFLRPDAARLPPVLARRDGACQPYPRHHGVSASDAGLSRRARMAAGRAA
jgi:hypothetical protein